MGSAPPNQTLETLHENSLNLIIRQGVALISVAIHLSLFWGDIPLWLAIFIAFHGLFYVPALHYLPFFRAKARLNLMVDTAFYGICIGLWGFNPFLTACYVASANIINMAAGGPIGCFRSLLIMILMSLVGGAVHGWQFRIDTPLATNITASAGLIFFTTALGVRIFSINTRLRVTRNDLREQKEELLHLNTLALAVNAHLKIDVIMQSVMQTIERLYPFEALYILSFDESRTRIEVSGIYGSSITTDQHRAFMKFQFDLNRDRDSMFVRGMLNKKSVNIPLITQEMVLTGAKIDRELFAVKPSLSLAFFPVYVDDQVIAGACFINYHQPFQLDKTDMARIQQYLIQVGTAVRNTNLFKELEASKAIAEQARKEAEASEEAKGRFLANMSHEIRTPLTAIMGYSEALLDDDVAAADRNQFISQILRSGKHLLSMINDILDISKIEASKIEVERIQCDLLEIVCDIDSYLAIKTKEKNLYFKIEVNFPIPKTIVSDPTRLKQILLNLCNNAVKFTESGGITMAISTMENNCITIEVKDTGIGIRDSDHEKIFSAFDQADTSTTRLYGGTGLGLFISKNLALLLGGELSVKNNDSRGSCFILTTPIGCQVVDTILDQNQFDEIMEQVRDSKTFPGVPSLTGKVLVAEDNAENQVLIERLIKQTGMQVDIVSNGEQALEAAQTQGYSVILMDMQMPIMGGREATLKIRKAGINIPIIAFTANVMKHQIEDYCQFGFCEVLEKPIIRERLFECLRSAVQQSSTKSAKVLIVEDNEVNQMILYRYVTKNSANAKVTLANNGQEALEKVQKEPFDLIFMDMQMPIMGGIEATQNIRQLGFKTPIYMVTGNVSKNDIDMCLQAGASGHLAKPIDKDQIEKIIAVNLVRANISPAIGTSIV